MPSRRGGADILSSAVNAGTMLSSQGRASAAPRPCRIVRRGNAFFVTIMTATCSFQPTSRSLWTRRLVAGALHRACAPHLEWHAVDDAHDQRRPAVVVMLGLSNEPPDGRCIVGLEVSAKRVAQQLLRDG